MSHNATPPRQRDRLVNPDELGPAQPGEVDREVDGKPDPLQPDERGEDSRLDDADRQPLKGAFPRRQR